MASDDIWILGINMTKFGKHPDKDTVDLASQAAMAALKDGGVSMKDMGVLAAGCLMGGGGIAQMIQKQIGQTGIPVYNVSNACATGATALARGDHVGEVGRMRHGSCDRVSRSSANAGLLAGRGPRRRDSDWHARGPLRRSVGAPRRSHRHRDHAGRLRAGRDGVRRTIRGRRLRLFRPDLRRRTTRIRRSTRCAYQKKFTLDEIKNDMMISYPNTRPMCSANCDGAVAAVVVSDAKLKTLSLEQQRRAVKVSASVLTSDPWQEACQVLPDVNTLTRRAAEQAYAAGRSRSGRPRPRRTARLLRHRGARPLRQPDAVRARRSRRLLRQRRARGATARPPSTSRAVCSQRATRSPPLASPTSGRSAITCAVRPAIARSRAPGRPRPRDRARLGMRRAHPGEVRRLTVGPLRHTFLYPPHSITTQKCCDTTANGVTLTRRARPYEFVVGVVDRARSGIGGETDVFEAHAPLACEVDPRLDAERVTRLQRQAVAFDHVRVFVLLHADAVAGAVHEVLAVTGGGDDPRAHDRPPRTVCRPCRRRRCVLCLVQHGVRLGDLGRRIAEEDAAGDVAAVPVHRAAEVAEHDLAVVDHAITGVVVWRRRVLAGRDDGEVDTLVTLRRGSVPPSSALTCCLGSTDKRDPAGLQIGGDPVDGGSSGAPARRSRLRPCASAERSSTSVERT